MLCHAESGEWMSSNYPINVKDASNPQQLGSALSYARRYGLQSVLLLNASDDDGSVAAVATEVVKPKLSTKSSKWTESIEKYVIDQLGIGKSADVIITAISKKYELSEDVIKFINDNYTPETK
jgi:hypothetical protein